MVEISVIIPSYNRAHLLEHTVGSVRNQDFEDLEILIVDDGSADDTAKVVANLRQDEPRIRLVQHSQNRGEAAARNTGLRESKGRLIAFLDSDDSWLDGKLHRQHAALEAAGPDVAAVVTGNIIVSQDGDRHYDDAWHFHEPITVRNLLVKGCAIGLGGNVLMRREAALSAGLFDETLHLYVDVDWLCRFLSAHRMVAINEPFTLYNKAALRDGKFVEAAIEEFLAKNADLLKTFSKRDRRLILSQFRENVAVSHKANNNRWGFVRASARSLAGRPNRPIGAYVEFVEVLTGIKLRPRLRKLVARKGNRESGGQTP